MQSVIKDKQREAYNDLLQVELPKLIRNASDSILDDYKIAFEPFPFSKNDAVVEADTEYIPIRTKCILTNRSTGESIEFNIDLLHLPVFHELGFKIRGNYMQMLDLYERTYGWSFSYKGTESAKNGVVS